MAFVRTWLASLDSPTRALFVAATALRLWLAIDDHSVFWPDEIYQSVEPAHRVAFGYGLLPWEFRDGARSWLLPGLLVPALQLGHLLSGGSPFAIIVAARLVMVGGSILGVAAGIEYARRLGGRSAGLLAAVSLALLPPLLVFSHRTMQETASAPFVVLLPLLLMTEGQASARRAGITAGLATLLRFQCAVIAAVFFVGLLLRKRFADARVFALSGALVIVGGGILDFLTWGKPFHSFITYVRFNLILGGASTFGVSPPAYFFTTLWSSIGPTLILLAAGFAIGSRRAPFAAGACILFLLLHSAIPHKEFRFLVPVLPLMLSVAACGIAVCIQRLPAPALATPALAALLALACARSAYAARYQDLGQYEGTSRAGASPWNTEEELNLLLSDAGRRPDLCGVLVLGARAAFTGAYSYLHRNVPLLYRHQVCETSKVANYIVAATGDRNVPSDYREAQVRGDFALYRRDGACSPPPPEFDHMLEGADDMGLGRAPIRQPDLSEISIAAGSSAAAFVHGFSHGEHLECRNVRWAVGRSSEIAFNLEPTGSAYTLSFTAQPYFRARPQTVSVRLNGGRVATYTMSAGWDGYQADVRPDQLKRGRNVLAFEFSNAIRAEGDDRRELAVLFERVKLTPMEETTEIDVGTAVARVHLRDGFGVDETAGNRTFAWSTGPRSQVSLTLGRGSRFRALRVIAHAFEPIAPVDVDVIINGIAAGRIRVPARWVEASVPLPGQAVAAGLNSVELSYSRTAAPRDVGPTSLDGRDLGVMIDRVVIDSLEPATRIDVGTPAARPYLLSGFSSDEKEADRSSVWSDGPVSTLALPVVHSLDTPSTLVFVIQGFRATIPQEVSVFVNDRRLGELTPAGTWRREHLAVPPGWLVSGVNLIQLRYPRTARPRDTLPDNADARELALRFDVVELTRSVR